MPEGATGRPDLRGHRCGQSGILSTILRRRSAALSLLLPSSLSKRPGAIALTRMPYWMSSIASARVTADKPALDTT